MKTIHDYIKYEYFKFFVHILTFQKSVQACSFTLTVHLLPVLQPQRHSCKQFQQEMRFLLPLLLALATVEVKCINYGYGRQPRAQRNASPPPEWFQEWERVRDVVPNAPPQKVFVEWPNNVRVQPNDTISTGLSVERPRLVWGAEPGTLYTVLFFDGWSDRVLPKTIMFWVVTNIVGNAVDQGNEVIEYMTPFAISPQEDGSLLKDILGSNHPMFVLVFKQNSGRILMEETQIGCTANIFFPHRVHYYSEFEDKYDLELVAGNYYQNPWSGFWTEQMLCNVTRCAKQPIPFPIEGVNDRPECQARSVIQDITVVSPVLSKRKDYARYRSLFSLYSITSEIKNLYPKYSTGKVRDFSAISGSYNGVPYGTENQRETLSGVFDASFFTYPKENTRELFQRAAELIPSIPKALMAGVFEGGVGYNVVLSEPQDEDWEFETILNTPGKIMEVFNVKVKEGQEETFQEMRERFITLARNTNNVENVYKFTVNRDIMQPDDPLFFDHTNIELTIAVYPDQSARRKAIADINNMEPGFIESFTGTSDCIMCALLEDNLHPTSYPPFADHEIGA